MENTIENKQKFFALYWGQNVYRVPTNNNEWDIDYEAMIHMDMDDWLELTPLSSITDEDVKHLNLNRNFVGFPNNMSFLTGESDYLRSKGYALPFMRLSVEKQIEYGWVKLENK